MAQSKEARIAVLGSGSWGTTLALLTARKGLVTYLWTRTPEEATEFTRDNENRRFLPGYSFPPNLRVTASLEEALNDCTLIIFAAPSSDLRYNARLAQPYLAAQAEPPLVVSAAKGLEMMTLLRMSQVLEEELPEIAAVGNVCALSGPNLSKEVAADKPGATVIAGKSEKACQQAQNLITTTTFRVYTNHDLIGVELGGALKNIIALGAGLSDGLEAGDNAKGAFMTRGIAEIGRLGVAAGADPLTFLGLAGLGDMVATCASPFSRNRYVGQELAKGRKLDEIRASMGQVAEGVYTTAAARQMALKYGVEMPITEQLYLLLFENKDPMIAITDLMMREPTSEMYGFRI
ncbi:MAG: NAD(P)-dependent glycerol-3-phosphate dehydrogenase [Chloroflexi bacterium]|nr:NAD(P)-dependent glycerol-3-phosphate dehydrogenase [Chloroflexota bacterium]